MLKLYGRAAASEFLDDFILYRNLEPLDPRLPSADDLRAQAGLPAGAIPRKQDPAYARLIVRVLREARRITAPQAVLHRLVFVGDTRLSDGAAFVSLCGEGGWLGMGFICAETEAEPAAQMVEPEDGVSLYLANRWAALADFDALCARRGFSMDAGTVVVLDLDKTTLGARGRNAHAIDAARVEAVETTVAGLLGADFAPDAFRAAYERLNSPAFHPFTADNQDYLAYICLVLGSGLMDVNALVDSVNARRMESFAQFIEAVEARRSELPAGLQSIHADIYARVQNGDPTPFKAFRRNEYRLTVGRMGALPEGAPLERILAEEIVLTAEVRNLARKWRAQGALVFALSDKPDEASLPTPELAEQGCLPIHRTETHVVGE